MASAGAASALDLLAQIFSAETRYQQLFETRLMQKRLELGLPLIPLGAIEDLPEPERGKYEDGVRQAAIETGALFLRDGDIARAWPYYRAIGDRETIAAAIEEVRPEDATDALIDIALNERVHPRKGLELVIARHGMCRAITFFERTPDLPDREACLVALVRALHAEVFRNLTSAILCRERQPPEANGISDLMESRDWLFGEFDSYTDTSHVIDAIRFALDLEDPAAIRLALELCDYGAHLSAHFKMRGNPPFEDIYRDHAIYLRALLGEGVDEAIAHFEDKIVAQQDPLGTIRSAEALVRLLVRIERYAKAVEVFLDYLGEAPPGQLACPGVFQLCQLAGESRRMRELARQRDDLLSFAAGAIQAESDPENRTNRRMRK